MPGIRARTLSAYKKFKTGRPFTGGDWTAPVQTIVSERWHMGTAHLVERSYGHAPF
jgi:hypothetical protein